MAKILVTGGCGFIGSHLVDRLLETGHEVSVLDDLSSGHKKNLNAKASLTQGDVADKALVEKLAGNADAIFHLAAIASVQVCDEQPELAHRTNVEGTGIVFATAAAKGIPVIYASSAAVYGDNTDLPLSETSATGPLGNYGIHKLQCEAAAHEMKPELKSVGLRFFNVFGPRQDPRSPYSGVISKFMSSARAGKTLTVFGDGTQSRDFIYVADVVELLVKAWGAAKGCEVFNGCTGQRTSLKQLITTIGTVIGSTPTVVYADARAGDIKHSLGSPLKAQNILSFSARTSLEAGLRALAKAEVADAA